ncbi:methanogen output domain 1-containing protein [Maricaulis sp.]|uniref:methanogen output domain 1-containing protein n=1 Tax=Maricaulis sp. TaxID=1486257 RepID=UPI00261307C9|nr:methanogen output domain 1-containing protein [Maricaulis sp.]
MTQTDNLFADLPITRDRDQFLRELVRELAGTLEDVVGLEDAEGFVSVVGNRIGDIMNREYRELSHAAKLDLEQVGAALVDLKRRIDGGFTVESLSDDAIVLTNTRCPFGQYVQDRPSLCMMTSNVFGRIAADNNGYARVAIPEAIARGDRQCRVVISLKPGAVAPDGAREYFARD